MDLQTTVAHTARVYDWYLGGRDNYEADRIAGERTIQVHPTVRIMARQNRDFMLRAVRYLAGQGIDQFLDIGTGIPTEPNLHQAAQEINPTARVLYVDNDPLVLTFARALMAGTPEGRTAYLHADLRQPDSILAAPELTETLDLSKPIAVSVVSILHFVEDSEDPYHAIAKIMDATTSGSYLVITHASGDFGPEMEEVERVYHEAGIRGQMRNRTEVTRFFDGMDWVEPGLTTPHGWRPPIEPPQSMDRKVQMYAGVARKV